MKRSMRLRRVVMLCTAFARNLAYHRAMMPYRVRMPVPDYEFWMTLSNNALDMSVLEWCKLLADTKDKHHWSEVVANPKEFEEALLENLALSAEQFADYQKAMRRYRDKFIAHLDNDLIMDVPQMDTAEAALRFYHRWIIEKEAEVGDLRGLPSTAQALTNYYLQEQAVAARLYNAGMPAA